MQGREKEDTQTKLIFGERRLGSAFPTPERSTEFGSTSSLNPQRGLRAPVRTSEPSGKRSLKVVSSALCTRLCNLRTDQTDGEVAGSVASPAWSRLRVDFMARGERGAGATVGLPVCAPSRGDPGRPLPTAPSLFQCSVRPLPPPPPPSRCYLPLGAAA